MPYEVIDERQLRTPIIREAAEVGDDERDVRIFGGDQLDLCHLAHHVVQHWNAKRSRHLAHLTRDRRIVAMELDPAKAVTIDSFTHERTHSAGVTPRVHEREAEESPAIRGDDSRDLAIRHRIVAVERREQHSVTDPGVLRPAQIVA